MNEQDHFARFKRAHKLGMSVAQQIVTPNLTSNGNGHTNTMQGIKHLPDRLPWSIRLREYFKREWLRVVSKADTVATPKWIASAILVAVLAFGVQSWVARSADHDAMIEIKTELRLAKEAELERSRATKEQADLNKVYIDNTTNQLNMIKGMLSQQQINSVERNSKKTEN